MYLSSPSLRWQHQTRCMIPMALGLRASPHTKFTPITILATSISGFGPLIKFPKLLHSLSSLQLRFRITTSNRFLCSCANQHAAIDVSKYKEAFANRMAMAGLKPHHRLGNSLFYRSSRFCMSLLRTWWYMLIYSSYSYVTSLLWFIRVKSIQNYLGR